MYRLTDEEIIEIVKSWEPKHYGAKPHWWVTAYKDIADAAQAKLQKHYRDMTPEELREEVAKTTRDFWERRKTSLECAAQTLSLVTPQIIEQYKKRLKEKIKAIENPFSFMDGNVIPNYEKQYLAWVAAIQAVKDIVKEQQNDRQD